MEQEIKQRLSVNILDFFDFFFKKICRYPSMPTNTFGTKLGCPGVVVPWLISMLGCGSRPKCSLT